MRKLSEPILSETASYVDMIMSFNWYSENYSWADSKKFIVEYLKSKRLNKKADTIKKGPEYEICWVCGWIARMISNGSKITIESQEYFDTYVNNIKE